MDELTAELIAEKRIWWCVQPFLEDEDASPLSSALSNVKSRTMTDATDRAYELAKKHGVRPAWGTDTLFDARLATRQGAQLAKMVRWFSPAEVLKMASADNAGCWNCRVRATRIRQARRCRGGGRAGRPAAGRGNSLENIRLLENPAQNLAVIMKDGAIVKNELA